jgi:hypothetical protein
MRNIDKPKIASPPTVREVEASNAKLVRKTSCIPEEGNGPPGYHNQHHVERLALNIRATYATSKSKIRIDRGTVNAP